jgi:hypothetical protein
VVGVMEVLYVLRGRQLVEDEGEGESSETSNE